MNVEFKIPTSYIKKAIFHLLVKDQSDVTSILNGMEKRIGEMNDLSIILELKTMLREEGNKGILNWHDDVFGEFGMVEKDLLGIYKKIEDRLESFDWSLLS